MVNPVVLHRPAIGDSPSPPPPMDFRSPFQKRNCSTSTIDVHWEEGRREQIVEHKEAETANPVIIEKMEKRRMKSQARDVWKKEKAAVMAYFRANPHLKPKRVMTTKKKLPKLQTTTSEISMKIPPLMIRKVSKDSLQNDEEMEERLAAVPEVSTPRFRSPGELAGSPLADMSHMPSFAPIGTHSRAFSFASSSEYSDSKAKSLLGLDTETQPPTRPPSLASQLRSLLHSNHEADSPPAYRTSLWMRVRNAVTDTGSHVGGPRTKNVLRIDTTNSTTNVNKSLPATPRTPRTPLFRSKSRRVKFRSRIASYSSIKNKRPLRNKRVSTASADVETLKAIAYNPHGPPILAWERASPISDSDSDWEDQDSPVRESPTSSYTLHTLPPVCELPSPPTPTPVCRSRLDFHPTAYLPSRLKPEREPEPYRGSFTPQVHITSLDDPLQHYGLYSRCFPASTSTTALPTPRAHRPFSQLGVAHYLRGAEDHAKSSAVHLRSEAANNEKLEILERHPKDPGYALAAIRRYNERFLAEQNSYPKRLEFLRAEMRKKEAEEKAKKDAEEREAWIEANSPWYRRVVNKGEKPLTPQDLGSAGPASVSTWSLDSQDKPGAGKKFTRALHRIHSPSTPTLRSTHPARPDPDVLILLQEERPPGKLRKFFSTDNLVGEVGKLERFVTGKSKEEHRAELNRQRLKGKIKVMQGASEAQYREMRLMDTMRQDMGMRGGQYGRVNDYV